MSISEINTDNINNKKYKFVAYNFLNLNESKEFTDLIKAQKWADDKEKEGKNIDIITISEWLSIQYNELKKRILT